MRKSSATLLAILCKDEENRSIIKSLKGMEILMQMT